MNFDCWPLKNLTSEQSKKGTRLPSQKDDSNIGFDDKSQRDLLQIGTSQDTLAELANKADTVTALTGYMQQS